MLKRPSEVTLAKSGRFIERARGAARVPRLGWDQAFKRMAEHRDDAPIFPDDLEDSFEADWEW
jgi:hypothetical protein